MVFPTSIGGRFHPFLIISFVVHVVEVQYPVETQHFVETQDPVETQNLASLRFAQTNIPGLWYRSSQNTQRSIHNSKPGGGQRRCGICFCKGRSLFCFFGFLVQCIMNIRYPRRDEISCRDAKFCVSTTSPQPLISPTFHIPLTSVSGIFNFCVTNSSISFLVKQVIGYYQHLGFHLHFQFQHHL